MGTKSSRLDSPLPEGGPRLGYCSGQQAGWRPQCVQSSQFSSHPLGLSLSLLQGLVLEPLLLLIFPTFLFPRPTGLGRVILGKSLVIPGFLQGAVWGVVSHPKQISLECLRSS